MSEYKVVGQVGGDTFIINIDGLGRRNETVLFENSETVFIFGNWESIRDCEPRLILSGCDLPETNLCEAVFLDGRNNDFV